MNESIVTHEIITDAIFGEDEKEAQLLRDILELIYDCKRFYSGVR